MTTRSDKAQFGDQLRAQRKQRGWSIRELARRAGVNPTTVMRLEDGSIARPTPSTLAPIAEALTISLSDILVWANYTAAGDLPSFRPYLRSKYSGLPADAVSDLDAAFQRVLKQHGYDADGPKPGEDEAA